MTFSVSKGVFLDGQLIGCKVMGYRGIVDFVGKILYTLFIKGVNVMCEKCNEVTHAHDMLFQGNVLSIYLSSITPINNQSCDVQKIYLEYADRVIILEHRANNELGSIYTIQVGKEDFFVAGKQITMNADDTIMYRHSTYENGELDALSFSWNDTWLHIFRMEYDLAVTRSSFDLTSDEGWPSENGEPHLMWK